MLTAVAAANAAQLAAWDGPEGDTWTAHATVFEESVAAYDGPFLAAARLGPGSRVLDVGCGTGATTRAAARRAPGGSVTGVDLSAAMLEHARALGPPGVTYLQADAQVHPFPAEAFDVVLSRTGAMFFADPAAAFANLARALRPGGRMVLLTWQPFAANAWLRELGTALSGRTPPEPPPGPGPFGLADPGRVRALLTGAGLAEVRVDGVVAPLVLGRDPEQAEAVVLDLLGWMLAGPDRLPALRALLRARSRAGTEPGGVSFGSAAWLTTAHRR